MTAFFIIMMIVAFIFLRFSKAFITRLTVVIFIIAVVALYTGKFKLLIGLVPLGVLWIICATVIRHREMRRSTKVNQEES